MSHLRNLISTFAVGICLFFYSTAHGEQLKILVVAPEFEGVMQTGGLAAAVTGIARGLQQSHSNIYVETLIPGYTHPQVRVPITSTQKLNVHIDNKNLQFEARSGEINKMNITELHQVVGEEGPFFHNPREPGKKPTYGDHSREWLAFGAFSKAAAQYALAHKFDVVISHDWTTGLVSTYLRDLTPPDSHKPVSLFMVHNIAYQGVFSKHHVPSLQLNWNDFKPHGGFEYYDQISYLKAGLVHSDYVLTVSPNYAREIQTPRFGMGLDGVARELHDQGRLGGILNGIHRESWTPDDFHIEDFAGKAIGKAELLAEFNLESAGDDVPLIVMTSRLDAQKGLDYLLPALETALQTKDFRLIIIGDGEAKYRDRLIAMQEQFKSKMHYEGFSSPVEKRLMRYGDFFINAAWFEPSGLNQFYAKANGTIPILSTVGGLADSITHLKEGFLFRVIEGDTTHYDVEATANEILNSLSQALFIYNDKAKLTEMRKHAMSVDNSWSSRIQTRYLPLIRNLLDQNSNPCAELLK